jgi:hypothetical protein
MRLPVFVKFLLGALGIVAIIFVMVKVWGVRNIFLVIGFLVTGLNIFAIANWFPVRKKWCRSYPHDPRARFSPSHFLYYIGATSLLAYLAATAVGFVAGAAVALVAAAVCIFFIFAPKQEESGGMAPGAISLAILYFPIVLVTFVVACVAFLIAIYFNQ